MAMNIIVCTSNAVLKYENISYSSIKEGGVLLVTSFDNGMEKVVGFKDWVSFTQYENEDEATE